MRSDARIYPLPVRIQNAEAELRHQFREKAQHVFAPYLTYLHDENEYWDEVGIPEMSYYAFTHQLPILTERGNDRFSLSAAYRRFIAYLTDPSATTSMPLGDNSSGASQTPSGNEIESDWKMFSSPYEGEDDYGFVSYARDDVHIVMPIVQDIADLDYHLWWDEGIPGSIEWLPHLEDKIRQSKYLLIFLSQRAVVSEHVRKEIEIAKENQKTILGIRVDRSSLPQPIQDLLGAYQILDVSAVAFEENLGKTLGLITRPSQHRESNTLVRTNPDTTGLPGLGN
jgi:hypothetical protein